MANTLTCNWTEPTQRTDGTAMLGSEIAFTEVFLQSVANGPFVSIAKVAPGTTQTITQTLVPGTYTVRLVVTDTQVPPVSSVPLDKSATLVAVPKASPKQPTNFTIVVS